MNGKLNLSNVFFLANSYEKWELVNKKDFFMPKDENCFLSTFHTDNNYRYQLNFS